MRVNSSSKFLFLLLPFALALPAVAEEGEEITEELPDWARAELEEVRAWEVEAAGVAAPYGADIPSPEEVIHGRAPSAPQASQAAPARSMPEPEDLTFDDFREGLAPHGRWVHTPEYGLVFIPSRASQVAGWRPYLYGQWVWTKYGWTWVSDEPFGWATYHYGRWGFRAGIGWFWVPGYVWAPAWVAWRHGPDSIGWAPLYPGYVRVTASYPVVVDHWIFVGHAHFHSHPIHRHWHRRHIHVHYHRSHWAKNWRRAGRVYAGPPRGWVERYGGRVREVEIVHVRRPAPSRVVSVGGRRQVEVYRPSAKGAVRPVAKRPTSVRVTRPTAGSGLSRVSPKSTARREAAAPPAPRRSTPTVNRPSTSQRSASSVNPRSAPQRSTPTVNPRSAPQRSAPRLSPQSTPPRSSPSLNRQSTSQRSNSSLSPRSTAQRSSSTVRSFSPPSMSPSRGSSSGSRVSSSKGSAIRSSSIRSAQGSRGGRGAPARAPASSRSRR